MALVVKDRVKESASNPGTGTVTLSGAVAGFRSFGDIGSGNTTYYVIFDVANSLFEVGEGTYTDNTGGGGDRELARNEVLQNSSGNTSKINFTGSVEVFVALPASKSVHKNNTDNLELTGDFTITSGSATDQIVMKNTNTGTSAAPDLVLWRDSASPANADSLGRIDFRGEDDGSTARNYTSIESKIVNVAASTPTGAIHFKTLNASTTEADVLVLSGNTSTFSGNVNVSGDVDIGSTGGGAKLSIAGGVGTQNGTESAPTHTFYSDTDTGMFRPGANALAFSTGGSQAMNIDSSQRVTISHVGTDTTLSGGQPGLQVTGSGFDGYMSAVRRDSSAFSSGIILAKSRNTTADNFTIVQDNDQLGSILFIGDDGTDLDTYGAFITAEVNGTPASNNMPTDLIFATNGGSASASERMRIDKSGNVLVGRSALGISNTGHTLAAAGYVEFTRDGAAALNVGRNSSFGDTAVFWKDGVEQGRIASENGYLRIEGGNGSSAGSGLLLTNTVIAPRSAAGASTNGTIDLGYNTERFKDLYLGGIGYASSSFRAPIFYDSDNTSYYIDGASNSNFYQVRAQNGGIIAGTLSQPSSAGQIAIYSGADPYMSWHNGATNARHGYIQHIGGSDSFYFGEVSYTESANSFRAPIFYDTGNTSYYADPASTSVLNYARVGSLLYVGTTSGLSSAGQIGVYSSGGPYISFHSGTLSRTAYIQESGGAFYLWEAAFTEMSNQARAPIFYDSNNTAYYCDPNSWSTLYDVNIIRNLSLAGSNGTAGQVLQTNGPNQSPTWVDAGGSNWSTLSSQTTTSVSSWTYSVSTNKLYRFIIYGLRPVANHGKMYMSFLTASSSNWAYGYYGQQWVGYNQTYSSATIFGGGWANYTWMSKYNSNINTLGPGVDGIGYLSTHDMGSSAQSYGGRAAWTFYASRDGGLNGINQFTSSFELAQEPNNLTSVELWSSAGSGTQTFRFDRIIIQELVA